MRSSSDFGEGVAGQVHGGAHDLFLVDRDAEGLLENRFQRGVAVLDRFLAVHALDVGGDELQRAGAVERHHGDDVVQVLRLHLHQVAGHARAFQLEDAGGVALLEELEGFRIVDRDVVAGRT